MQMNVERTFAPTQGSPWRINIMQAEVSPQLTLMYLHAFAYIQAAYFGEMRMRCHANVLEHFLNHVF